jgi:FkbM family methyltransferase
MTTDHPPVLQVGEGRFTEVRRRISTETPIIVDGGAYKGEMIDLFLFQYAAPVIHAFEANPRRAAKLRKKYAGRRNVHIHPSALAASNGRTTFHILQAGTLSSALVPKDAPGTLRDAEMAIVQRVEVDQVRLDDILEEGADILKLDLQGYELEALKGCGTMLERIKTVVCEVGFIERYVGQPLFEEVDRFLLSKGFELLDLYEPDRQPGDPLTHADAVYLNARFFSTHRNEISHRQGF